MVGRCDTTAGDDGTDHTFTDGWGVVAARAFFVFPRAGDVLLLSPIISVSPPPPPPPPPQHTLNTTFMLLVEHRPPIRLCRSSLDEVAGRGRETELAIFERGRRSNVGLTYKVVVVSGEELEAARGGRERPECDGEVHELLRLVAHRNDPRIRVRDAARLVLGLAHVVDDELLRLVVERARLVHRTDDVDLVVLERQIPLVYVDDVVRVVDPESERGGRNIAGQNISQ